MVNLHARALALSLLLRDQERIRRAALSILKLEDAIAVDDQLGSWGFAFDLLWRADLGGDTQDVRQRLIRGLQSRCDRVCDPSVDAILDPNQAIHVVGRLCKAYRSTGDRECLRAVLIAFRDCLRSRLAAVAAILQVHWFQVAQGLFADNDCHDLAEEARCDLVKVSRQAQADLVPINHTFTFTWDELHGLAAHFYSTSLEESLRRIVAYFAPKIDAEKGSMKRLEKQFILSSMMGKTFLGPTDHPVPVANTGAAGMDDDGRLIHHLADNLHFRSAYLEFVIHAVYNSFLPTTQQLVTLLRQSELFIKEQEQLLCRGVQSYFDNDFVVAIHILVPLIEAATRRVLETRNVSPLRASRRDRNAFQLMTFDQVLNHPETKAVLGEDRCLYLRVVFTDPRGWNLRNYVSHGMASDAAFDHIKADRVFHILLMLGLIRWQRQAPRATSDQVT